MVDRTVTIDTADGASEASLHEPEGQGPWPGVIMYPDACGLRDVFREMGHRLAALGYVVLVPDIYYRAGRYAPFDMQTVFTDLAERDRMVGMVHSVTADGAARDARAYTDFVLSLPESAGTAVGTTGYCLGGWLSLIVAGHLGGTVGAAASFHGPNLAAAEDPDSPHLLAAQMTAAVYVAAAVNDQTFPAEQRVRLEEALGDAGIRYTVETYPAAHGFAVPDNPTYNAAAAERHWQAVSQFFGTALPRPDAPGARLSSL